MLVNILHGQLSNFQDIHSCLKNYRSNCTYQKLHKPAFKNTERLVELKHATLVSVSIQIQLDSFFKPLLKNWTILHFHLADALIQSHLLMREICSLGSCSTMNKETQSSDFDLKQTAPGCRASPVQLCFWVSMTWTWFILKAHCITQETRVLGTYWIFHWTVH